MDTLLLVLALSLQAADAGYSCHGINNGTRYEVNPLMGKTCQQIVLRKAAITGVVLVLPGRARRFGLVALAVGGGVGLGVSLALK